MLTLYFRPGTCALAPYLALEVARAPYRAVDLTGQPELPAQLNPRGKVPVLEVDGQPLFENVAILTYIAERFPAARLLPAEALARAQCVATLAWFSSTLHIDYRRFLKPQLYSPEAAAHAAISAEGALQYGRDLDELDAWLRERRWVQGEQLTLADLYAVVFVQWACTSALFDQRWHGITRWLRALRQLEPVERVLRATGSVLLTTPGLGGPDPTTP